MVSETNAPAPTRQGRRDFLAGSLGAAASAALLAGGSALLARRAGAALPAQALRPPGALPEDGFTAACLRCGVCVRDCPYGTLKLARFGDGVGPGTPYFTAREVACEMCEDIPCVRHCPSGALDRNLDDIDRARMGLAVLVDQENCLNFLGLRCEVCYRVCPAFDRAITLEVSRNPRSDRHALFLPTVHSQHCTGCGKCEQSCVLDEAAIKVLPPALAQGRLGAHYRKGWEEKEKAGGALLEGIEEPEARQPADTVRPPAPAPAPAAPAGGGAGSTTVDGLKEGFK